MHKSSSATSNRTAHHRNTSSATASSSSASIVAAAAAAANLPFSIDHILSSGSAGSMPSSIKQAMSSYQDQNPHFLRQQQQQAAAMFMLNQAANPIGHHQATNGAGPHPQHQVDLMSSAAMLNEQLALLSSAQQQQQQQQQSHLLNPTALAAAAAQQQLHQQWQQQQQLMAVAAAMNQQQANSNPLSTLNSLNGPTGNSNAAPNHLLSCFMASMLLQQQKQPYQMPTLDHHQHQLSQQAQQHLILNQHAQSTNGFLSPLEQHQQQSKQANQLLSAHLAAAAAAAAAAASANNNHQRSPSLNLSSAASSNSTNSPVKQFLGTPTSQHQNELPNQRKSSPNTFRDYQSSPQNNSGSTSSRPKANLSSSSPAALSQQQSTNSKRQESAQSQRVDPASETNRESRAKQASNRASTDLGLSCGAGTALSSLSNFVSNSSLFGLDDDLAQQPKRNSSARGSFSATSHKSHRNQQNDSSGNDSPSLQNNQDDDKSSTTTLTRNTQGQQSNGGSQSPSGGILEAVSNVLLKGASPAVATTINTTLAKAPPELVQKQPAWVFCTRYSDRPSSGPRTRRAKSKDKKPKDTSKLSADEKRPRTAFTSEQLEKLREEFSANSYLDEKRRKSLAERLCLNENQIKIWFQNKRAKMKKQSNQPNPLRGLLVAGGLYNHSTATSDCSESYANGLADDVGNRAMCDVEPDDDDEEEVDDHDGENDGNNNNRESKSTTRLPPGDRSSATRQDNAARTNCNHQHDSQVPTGDTADTQQQLKRRRTSQSDGDDEDEAGGANQHIKRTKLNHMERNNNQSHQVVASPSSSRSQSPPQIVGAVATSALDTTNEEEPVISVS